MSLFRSRRWLVPLVVALVFLPACGDSSDDDATTPAAGPTSTALADRLAELANAGVFVGGVAMTGNLVAIHFDRADKDHVGMRVFVTDGLPDGNAEWFEGKADGETFNLTSKSGKATIQGTIESFDADGTVTLADGQTRNFFTRPAGDGAGVFEVTVAADGTWTGKSLDGSTLTAKQTGPYVEGSVVSSTARSTTSATTTSPAASATPRRAAPPTRTPPSSPARPPRSRAGAAT